MEGVFESIPADDGVKVFAGVLGGAGTQAVEAQGVFIVIPAAVLIFAAGIQLAEDQLPVILLLLLVPVHRTAAALVLHFDGLVQVAGDGNEPAVALPGLVDGVGQDLKYRVFAALQPIGAKDDAGAHPDPVGPLQRGDGFVSVTGFLLSHGKNSSLFQKCTRAHIIIQPNHTK